MGQSRDDAVDDADAWRYCDYAASAPPFPEALAAQGAAAAKWFANPSAGHPPGRAARRELERLRLCLAGLAGCRDGRLVLCANATEANNLVIHSWLRGHPEARVAVAPDCHASVRAACERYAGRRDAIPLDGQGRVTLPALVQTLTPTTRLACVSHAANETGVIHLVDAIADCCQRHGVACLIDGTQALGHIPVDLARIPCDAYTFSAHKFGGPRGCGGVVLRAAGLVPLADGGNQEWGLRPGTENLPGLAGTVAALGRSLDLLAVEGPRLRGLALQLVQALRRGVPDLLVNGDPATGLPGLVSMSFPGLSGQLLVAEAGLAGFALATGSACHADSDQASPAILALGRSGAQALGTVRVSFGRSSREDTATSLAQALTAIVRRQRG